ncbi:vomeronasal type-1 receptor 2-like [Manis pentadactyla]|uniref:vomeronasal type-1 receptor 2-like n=1 Tax=Manis pentadactyla TaxID=143292 RepID=UPI00255CD44D|nr:vomeronasal type-1 receptor 2-like [Manis pentadactyla]
MADLGWEHLLSDLECRLLFYLHRVGRDVAIGTTCLLSVCQMIIISPRTSGWAQFKVHAAKYMGTASVLGWVLNMLLNVMVLLYMTSREGGRNITRKREYHYCHSVTPSHTAQSVYVVLLVFHNGFCLGLMLWASGSLVFFLFRHKQRLQYIHSHHRPPRPSPETRAVQGVVVLVTFFVSFWGLSMLFHICLVVLSSPSWWLEDASTLITAGFPTVSPYILMGRDPRVSPLCLPTRTGALSH